MLRKVLVGGFVRDKMLGVRSKDIDFAVEAESFDAMREGLIAEGFKIHTETPEHFTIRCGVPEGSELLRWAKDADFVLCRKDGPSSDGRRPDFVEPGTLLEDIARRDFTVNAMAIDPDTGDLIDPHGGEQDLNDRVLRCVGEPMDRLREDALRAIRGFRFMVTKGLTPTAETWAALTSAETARLIANPKISKERIQGEMLKMMRHDTLASISLLHKLPEDTRTVLFKDGLWLKPTLEKA